MQKYYRDRIRFYFDLAYVENDGQLIPTKQEEKNIIAVALSIDKRETVQCDVGKGGPSKLGQTVCYLSLQPSQSISGESRAAECKCCQSHRSQGAKKQRNYSRNDSQGRSLSTDLSFPTLGSLMHAFFCNKFTWCILCFPRVNGHGKEIFRNEIYNLHVASHLISV